MISLDAFLTPYFPETESQFDETIVVMIDVLRASSTICAALNNGAKEVIASETLEKAVNIYGNLDKDIRFMGGERNCIKPQGFDAGNSPSDYSAELVDGKTVIVTTTNGTKLFQKAKKAKVKIIGSFVNFESVVQFLQSVIKINKESNQNTEICFLCAGTNGRLSYEDTLCAGAFINSVSRNYFDVNITDTAHAAQSLYEINESNLSGFIKKSQHAEKLKKLGFEKDINTCLTYNKYNVLPIIQANSIKKFEVDS
jgi:2-phosphosulfolactate phosphatase